MLTIEFNPVSFEDGRHGILMCTGSDGYLRLWSIDMRRKVASDPVLCSLCSSSFLTFDCSLLNIFARASQLTLFG